LNWRAEENGVVNSKDKRLFMSQSDSLPCLDVLKASIFALEASLVEQIFVSRTSNFWGGGGGGALST